MEKSDIMTCLEKQPSSAQFLLNNLFFFFLKQTFLSIKPPTTNLPEINKSILHGKGDRGIIYGDR